MVKIAGILLVCHLALPSVSFAMGRKPAGILSDWSVGMDVGGFEFKSFSRNRYKLLKEEVLEAWKEDLTLKIVRTEAEARGKFVSDRKYLLESLYLPTTSPYPEVITNVVACPEEFIPKAGPVPDGTLYSLLAGERFNYGICVQNLAAYRSAYGIFDCGEKGVFEVFLFSPIRGQPPETIAKTFSCL